MPTPFIQIKHSNNRRSMYLERKDPTRPQSRACQPASFIGEGGFNLAPCRAGVRRAALPSNPDPRWPDGTWKADCTPYGRRTNSISKAVSIYPWKYTLENSEMSSTLITIPVISTPV